MNVLIKKVETEEEYQQVLKLRREVFIEEQKVPEELEIDQHEKDATYFLLFLNNEAVGTGRYRPYQEQSIKFERILTLKKYRGLGLGKKLLNQMLENSIKDFPGKEPMMYSQTESVGFYEKSGWKIDGPEFIVANIKHYKMVYQQ